MVSPGVIVSGAIIKVLGGGRPVRGFLGSEVSKINGPFKGGASFDPSFFANQWSIPLEVLTMESPEMSSAVTKSQVESGATISDHVTPNPDKLQIEGIVSDTPVEFRVYRTTVRDAHKALKKLVEDREPFTFVGGLDVYRSMVMTKYNPVRNYKTGSILQFQATMERVKTVSTEVVENIAGVYQALAKKNSNQGTQPSTPIKSSQQTNVDAWGDTTTARAQAGG